LGIAKGETADLGYLVDWNQAAVPWASLWTLKAELAAAGIHFTPSQYLTLAPATPRCSAGCPFAMMAAGGWTFNGPGYEPSGEPLFQMGATWNVGLYASPAMDSLIRTVQTSDRLSAFHAYANYTATQLPVIWLPAPYSVAAVSRKLRGVRQSPVGSFFPEYWYFEKRS
jgi:ABC-type transport system substrate-binding protein